MLIAVRHGETALNGGDGKERSRGWLPVPLDQSGMDSMAETAQKLAPLRGQIAGLHSSDLVRAVQSAHEIGQSLGMPIQPTDQLRDWDTGDYTGQEISKILPATHKLIDTPDTPAPNGESYNNFASRVMPFLDKLINDPKGIHVAVTHNRVMTLLQALSANEGSHPDPDILKGKGPVEPGGFLIMGPGHEILHSEKPQVPAANPSTR